VTYGLFAILLLFYIVYFAIQAAIYPAGQPLTNQLNSIVKYAQQDKWAEAEETVDKLIETWSQAKLLVTLNYAEEDYSLFIDNLSRIQGAIQTKDATETVTQALSTIKLWNSFRKIIPEP